jgi:hypothetical protein
LANSYGLSMAFYVSTAICLVVIGLAFVPVLPGRVKGAGGEKEKA